MSRGFVLRRLSDAGPSALTQVDCSRRAGIRNPNRLWTYVRDERPFTGSRKPAALFFYSPDRKGEHPQAHLKDFRGVIHADGYAGFNELFAGGRIVEAGCWAHVGAKIDGVTGRPPRRWLRR